MQDHGKAQVLLGLCFYYGAGLLRSTKLATCWLLQACSRHVPQAHEVLRRITTRETFWIRMRTLVTPVYVGTWPAGAEQVVAEPVLPDPSILDPATAG